MLEDTLKIQGLLSVSDGAAFPNLFIVGYPGVLCSRCTAFVNM